MRGLMSPVVARDAVASDHLVYLWPFALGASVEVSCGDHEVAVMCPAWAVGDRLGPGRHNWQSPEPSKPVAVYFVLTGPVQVPFAMKVEFPLPGTGRNTTLHARGSVVVQVTDPGLLVAQFVGLPFDRVNEGLMHSVKASVERMLGKVLPRKVAMAGTTTAVCDPSTWPGLVAELSSYNPAVGAVHGVQFVQFSELVVTGDGPIAAEWAAAAQESTAKGPMPVPPLATATSSTSGGMVSGEIGGGAVSGEIGGKSDGAGSNGTADATAGIPLLPTGSRVLVAGADGLMHSALIRQAMQGYYELEIEASGDTVWVPVNMVTPQL